MIAHRLALVAAALAALVLAPLSACASGARESVAEARLVPLTIATAKGERLYQVEIARTAAEQERGLMFRTSLPRGGGMLFPFDRPRPASFWMKNTLIPLDMIFIRADGVIARIAANTVPESLELVDSGEPVIAVFEIAGGGAAAAGVAKGDRVRWPGGPK